MGTAIATPIIEPKETPDRDKVALDDRWNVEALYPSFNQWEEDLQTWGRESQKKPRWPEVTNFKGQLARSENEIASLLKNIFNIERHLSKLYTYAHLRHDEDVAHDLHKKNHARISALLYDFKEETSWIEPEILQIPEGKLNAYLKSEQLKEYRIYLEKIIRQKPHTLSYEQEELMALAGKALESSSKAFSAFNNADVKFAMAEDSQGRKLELTHGKFLVYLRERDRKLRQSAFENIYASYGAYENTLCEMINGEMQGHLFNARARKYSSCLEAALFPHQIDTRVYKTLIETVRKNIQVLHRYVALRKKLLGYSELHLYDLHVPLVHDVNLSMDYPKAVKEIVASVAPLGKEYQKDLEEGLKTKRWVDKYENTRKRSGAYSSGCYDSMPYILMNYHGTLNDVLTLAHEAGHSMHSLLSGRNQPYHYSHYPIFVAEVASTFNEELLLHDLLKHTKEKEKRAFLINQKIEDIRSTFFRQTMFAEFELRLHEWVEAGVPLTPTMLKQEYRKLNAFYFGPDLVIDEAIDVEWARIPHFYYNFYVYQYATGISAAHALVERVIQGDVAAKEAYLRFLSSGSSRYPVELLALAGVDMKSGEAIESTIRHFEALVEELEGLLGTK